MEFIRDFSRITKNDVALAGGKGASLGEMTLAGIAVPPGFVILASSFEKFLRETQIHTDIDAILHKVDHKVMESVEKASEEIEALILEEEIPQEIQKEIQKEFKELKTEYVAVRSSATAEDSSSAAWAGQLETYLNTTEKDLLLNVKKCWASLFTPRAIFYRFEKNLHEQHISVAVVVQKMVQSEIAGVAFSVHPVNQDKNQLIIEAGFGLGEAIVSGQITPDSYVVEKKNWSIIDINVAEQEKAIYRRKNGGNEWKTLPASKKEVQKLTGAQILELAKLVVKIEKHYGFPCDIEWALEKGKFYITQSRPITTLIKQNSKVSKQVESKEEESSYPIEHHQDLFKEKFQTIRSATWYRQRFDACPHFMFFLGDAHTSAIQNTAYPFGQRIAYAGFSKNRADWYHSVGELEYTTNKIIEASKKYPRLSSDMIREFQLWEDAFYNCCKELEKLNLTKLTPGELLAKYNKLADIYTKKLNSSPLIDGFALSTDTIIASKVMDFLKKKKLADKFVEYFELLTAPIYLSFLQLEEIVFLKIVQQIRKNSALKKILLKKHQLHYFWIQNNYVKDHILDYAYFERRLRSMRNINFSGRMRHLQSLPALHKKRKEGLMRKLQMTSELRSLFEITDDFNYWQDERKKGTFWATHYFSMLLKEFARRTHYTVDELKYVFPPEMDLVLTQQIDKSELHKRFEYCMLVWVPGKYDVITDRKLINELDAIGIGKLTEVHELKGFSACLGKVRGLVKVVESVEEIHTVKKGDIIVAVMTRPDYLPAMKKASAIITDEGGITCHAAIVSREMKKPCIIGTKIATKVLKDGDLVEVNATKGTIKILKKSQKA